MKRLKRKFSKEVEDGIENPKLRKKEKFDFANVVSTGSLPLDLAISGGRRKWGGIPSGMIMEIYGPEGSGKTALLAEIIASAQVRGGEAKVGDPESRLDQEYAKIYGMVLSKKGYYMPDVVEEVFDKTRKWFPNDPTLVNVMGVDSLAALSTALELEKGDKMGMKRAKDFSAGFRIVSRHIKKNGILMACTNQVREGDHGEVTPGGRAVRFYSSLRLRVSMSQPLIKTTKIYNKKVEKVVGIESTVYVKKSTVDAPYREAKIFIVFNYGIDDVLGNLQYIKDITNNTMYGAIDHEYQSKWQAIRHIEEMSYQKKLRRKVLDIWQEVEEKFKTERLPKVRF